MLNTKARNDGLGTIVQQMTQWHEDRNLIDGTTSQKQITKALEEFTEIYAALHPELETGLEVTAALVTELLELGTNGRIKPDVTGEGLADGIGDINVVLVNIAEREGLTMKQCFQAAYEDIKDRRGKMINGTFVKESDLEGK